MLCSFPGISHIFRQGFNRPTSIIMHSVVCCPLLLKASKSGYIVHDLKVFLLVCSGSLLTKLGIQDLDVVLRTGRMRWFGHVERSTGWISEVRKLNVVTQERSGRPRKSWDEVIKNDRKKLDMDSADPQNCSEWRGRLRGRLVRKAQPSVGENGL